MKLTATFRTTRIVLLLFPLLCLLALIGAEKASGQAMLTPHGQTTRLLPFLEYHIDSSASVDIDEIAILGQTSAFRPFDLATLPNEEGVMWLRFTLAPVQPDLHPGTYLLDMGQSVPGKPLLYVPVRNELSGAMEWRENAPAQRNIMLMPEQGRSPVTCYLRIEGLPGPWFNPVIRSPQNAASNWGSLFNTGSALTLAVVFLLCLLRGMQENGQWRIWTGLFVLFSLIQAILGMPACTPGFSITKLLAIMTPGLALMTLPHIGRHLLKTPAWSRSLDIQLLILSILGGACALIPMIPGLEWLNRWLELWPILIICLIPTVLGLWIGGVRGSRCFLLACLVPPVFTAFAWVGRDFGFSTEMLSSLPSWGIALCALLLISLPVNSVSQKEGGKQKKSLKPNPNDDSSEIINLNHPLDDPSLRLLPTNTSLGTIPEPIHNSQSDFTTSISYPKALASKEGVLRQELDALLRETASLSQCALPPASRLYAENIIKSAETLTRIVTEPDYRTTQENTAAVVEDKFNLQSIIRSVHDQAAPIAEHAGLSLSWYMPPFLQQEYLGDSAQLAHILSLLVDSAIRGTTRGSIKLSVRRVPESDDPGHLLFTVSDTGDGAPPLHRSAVALAKAWELSSRYNGFLGLESGPGGLSIAFSAHFNRKQTEEIPQERKIQAIIAGSRNGIRNELAQLIEEIPFGVSEVNTIADALKKQYGNPVSLLVVSDDEAKPASGDTIAEFVKTGLAAGYETVSVLAITRDESQWKLLKASGFTHAMLEPVEPDAFKKTILSLVSSQPENLQNATSEKKSDKTMADESENSADSIIDLMDSFYAQSSDIVSDKKPMNPVEENFKPEKAPRMIDQQEFDLSSGFEGPDWLTTEKTPENSPTEKERSTNRQEISHYEADDILAETGSHENAVDDAPHELGDIVIGEPFPAQNSSMHVTSGYAKTPTPQSMQAVSVETKGNTPSPDVPANSHTDSYKKETSSKNSGDSNSVMDLIVSVNAATEKNSEKIQTEEKKSAEQPLSVNKTHVESPLLSSDSVIKNILSEMDNDLRHAQTAFKENNCAMVEEATATMAIQAENYGYRIVGRLARCVERAARARDLPALGDLLPVLADAVERNRIAASQRENND